MKVFGVISIKLKYEIPEDVDAKEWLENVELPKGYVEDSFEMLSITEIH